MREFGLMLIALISYPIIPLWDLGVALLKCVLLLSIYPIVVVACVVLCFANRDSALYVLDKWRRLANIGTKYEE